MSTAIPSAAPTTAAGPSASSPDIQLAGVSKAFKDVTVVDDLDLSIERGRFYALLGPSGCGKTTTLRMIGGFEEPTAGRVLLGGEDVTTLPPHKRDVNTVFQSYALFPHLSVEKNVAFGLRERKVSKHEIRSRVAEALETVQLSHLARRKPAQLSGGQAQRVALARALVNRPRALLLDEPLGALDLRLRRQLQLELKAIQQEIGITFVHVTHDQEEAMTMADTIAVMNAGRIEQAGSAQELYERPETAFVANFLGVSNLIPAEVSGREGEDVVLRAHGGTQLRATAARLPEPGATSVRAGVRPEKVQLGGVEEVPREGVNALRGRLVLSSYLGVSLQHVVRCDDGLEVTVISQNVEGEHAVPRAVGSEVAVWWDPRVTFLVEAAPADAS